MIRRTRAEVLKLWVAALRSGEYEQANGSLCAPISYDDNFNVSALGYCCLGVLCDLASKDGGPKWAKSQGGDHYYFEEKDSFLPKPMAKFMKLSSYQQDKLADMNDGGKSFEDIADYIHRKYISKQKA